MESEFAYAVMSVALVALGFYGLVVRPHMIRKLLAVNVLGSGAFALFLAMAARGARTDPVVQAMVLTGIVVAISATALGLVLIRRIYATTGTIRLTIERRAEEVDEEVG